MWIERVNDGVKYRRIVNQSDFDEQKKILLRSAKMRIERLKQVDV